MKYLFGNKAASYHFPKNVLGVPNNYREITLTPITAKLYNAMLLNTIKD